jgi:hypothetical protein
VNEDERVCSAARVHAQGAKLPEPAPDPSAPESDPSKQGRLRTLQANASPYAMPPLRKATHTMCLARDPVHKSHRQPSENVAAFFASSRGGTAEEEKEGLGLAFNSDKDMEGAFRSPRPTPQSPPPKMVPAAPRPKPPFTMPTTAQSGSRMRRGS